MESKDDINEKKNCVVFEPQLFRRNLCRNCFKTVDEHKVGSKNVSSSARSGEAVISNTPVQSGKQATPSSANDALVDSDKISADSSTNIKAEQSKGIESKETESSSIGQVRDSDCTKSIKVRDHSYKQVSSSKLEEGASVPEQDYQQSRAVVGDDTSVQKIKVDDSTNIIGENEDIKSGTRNTNIKMAKQSSDIVIESGSDTDSSSDSDEDNTNDNNAAKGDDHDGKGGNDDDGESSPKHLSDDEQEMHCSDDVNPRKQYFRQTARDESDVEDMKNTSDPDFGRSDAMMDGTRMLIDDLRERVCDERERNEHLERERVSLQELLSLKRKECEDIENEYTTRLDVAEEIVRHLESEKERLLEQMHLPEKERSVHDRYEKDIITLEKKLEESENRYYDAIDDNESLRNEVRDLHLEMEEIYDQYREEEAIEVRELQKELDIAAKNCRVLQFKLRKSERRNEQLENDRIALEETIEHIQSRSGTSDDKVVIKLEEDLKMAKEVSVRLHDELEVVGDKRRRYEEELDRVTEILSESESKRRKLQRELSIMDEEMDILKKSAKSKSHRSRDSNTLPDIASPSESKRREGELKEQLRYTEDEIRIAKKRIRDLEADNESLTLELNRSNVRYLKNNDMVEKERQNELKLQLELAEQEIKVLQTKVHQLEDENEENIRKGLENKSRSEELESTKSKADSQNVDLQKKIKELEAQLNDMRQENEKQQGLLSHSRDALSELRNKHDTSLNTWNEEKDQLLEKVRSKEQMAKKLKELEQLVINLKEEIHKSGVDLCELKTKFASEKAAWQSERSNLAAKLKKAEEKASTLENTKTAKATSVSDFKSKFEKFGGPTKSAKSSSADDTTNVDKEEYNEMKHMVKSLQGQIRKMERESNSQSVVKLEKQRDDLQKELHDYKYKVSKLEKLLEIHSKTEKEYINLQYQVLKDKESWNAEKAQLETKAHEAEQQYLDMKNKYPERKNVKDYSDFSYSRGGSERVSSSLDFRSPVKVVHMSSERASSRDSRSPPKLGGSERASSRDNRSHSRLGFHTDLTGGTVVKVIGSSDANDIFSNVTEIIERPLSPLSSRAKVASFTIKPGSRTQIKITRGSQYFT